jgi:putative acetyltransferase
MTESIYKATPALYPTLIDIWEASVRATHHFLKQEDILFYKQLVTTYLPAMDVYCLNFNDTVAGFIGLSEGMIEALFVHPDLMGKGIGKALLQFAIDQKGIKRVDVNEQNEDALAFYQHHGFGITGRSDLDASGRDYPILMLELAG